MNDMSRWTGLEARLLRLALRMTVRAFAEYLGVSARAISKWEACGASLTQRPDTQAILDTVLQRAAPEARKRFEQALPPTADERATLSAADAGLASSYFLHPVDHKHMVLVPPIDAELASEGQPNSAAGFLIDVTPVTNAEYQHFVRATGHRPPTHWGDGAFPAGRADHPVTYVTHFDATTYAAWATKTLPSTGEWETSARGPRGLAYPWGDQPTAMKCNVRESAICDTTPVYRYHSGASAYGVYDLAGNVWEWCRTPTSPGRFALKGSAFTSPMTMAAATQTNDAAETMLDDDTGFRCVAGVVTEPVPEGGALLS